MVLSQTDSPELTCVTCSIESVNVLNAFLICLEKMENVFRVLNFFFFFGRGASLNSNKLQATQVGVWSVKYSSVW